MGVNMPDKDRKKYKVSYFSIDKKLRKSFAEELGGCKNNSHSINTESFFRVLPLPNKKDDKIHFFCLKKYRIGNLPKVGSIQTNKEKDLQLSDDEGLIEKAYFAFLETTGEIALQNNSASCYRSSFPGIIKGIMHNNTIKIDLIQSERTLRDDDKVAAFDVSIRYSQLNTEEAIALGKRSDVSFGKEVIGLGKRLELADSQKLRVAVTLGRDAKTRKPVCSGKEIKGLPLDNGKIAILDGIDPELFILDIMGTPKIDEINVRLDGHYPIESEIIRELRRCLSH